MSITVTFETMRETDFQYVGLFLSPTLSFSNRFLDPFSMFIDCSLVFLLCILFSSWETVMLNWNIRNLCRQKWHLQLWNRKGCCKQGNGFHSLGTIRLPKKHITDIQRYEYLKFICTSTTVPYWWGWINDTRYCLERVRVLVYSK